MTARSRASLRAEPRAPSPRWGCSHGGGPAAPRVLRVCALTPARRLEGGKAAAARPGPSRLRGRRGFEGRRGTPGSEKRRLPPVGREGRGDAERGRHALGGLALGAERPAAGRALPARPVRPGASHARSSSAGQHHPRPHGKDGGSEGGSAPRGEGTPPRGRSPRCEPRANAGSRAVCAKADVTFGALPAVCSLFGRGTGQARLSRRADSPVHPWEGPASAVSRPCDGDTLEPGGTLSHVSLPVTWEMPFAASLRAAPLLRASGFVNQCWLQVSLGVPTPPRCCRHAEFLELCPPNSAGSLGSAGL